MNTEYLKALVVLGSDSDLDTMKPCFAAFRDFGIDFDCHICSAHRTPFEAAELAGNAEDEGFGVIIAAAGKAAHLPGVLAAYTALPVIGVPLTSDALEGMDALLAIAQMPPGVPVATVAINGAVNAAVLAAQILSAGSPELRTEIKEYKEGLRQKVLKKDRILQEKIQNGEI